MPYEMHDTVFCGLCSKGFKDYKDLAIHHLQHSISIINENIKKLQEEVSDVEKNLNRILEMKETDVQVETLKTKIIKEYCEKNNIEYRDYKPTIEDPTKTYEGFPTMKKEIQYQ